MTKTPLVNQIAAQIVEHIRQHKHAPGTRLIERRLADDLRVSRSPVRSALKLLEQEGVVGPADRGGFVVLASGLELPAPCGELTVDHEKVYLRVAKDRLNQELPDRMTENELARRYGLTRSELAELLRRMSKEGWIERLPGYGWEFLPMLTTLRMYEDSYHFRLVIEPAAILETTFSLDHAALVESRDQQQRLVDGDIWTVSDAELFDLNSHHHEVIIGCSNNSYFIDALQRVNRTRRLIEYRRSLQREKAVIRCREHVQVANLLLDGDTARASSLMHRHLATVGAEKTAR